MAQKPQGTIAQQATAGVSVRSTAANDITINDQVVLISAAGTYDLPAPTTGKVLRIKKIVAGSGSATDVVLSTVTNGGLVDGIQTCRLQIAQEAVDLISDGADWHILGQQKGDKKVGIDAGGSTANEALTTIATINLTPDYTGPYVIRWYVEHSNNTNNDTSEADIQVDGTTVGADKDRVNAASEAGAPRSFAGSVTVAATAGVALAIAFRAAAPDGGTTALVRCRVSIERFVTL